MPRMLRDTAKARRRLAIQTLRSRPLRGSAASGSKCSVSPWWEGLATQRGDIGIEMEHVGNHIACPPHLQMRTVCTSSVAMASTRRRAESIAGVPIVAVSQLLVGVHGCRGADARVAGGLELARPSMSSVP
eukprot:11222249-Alexandrium_andersonii.AAC.1